MCTLYILYTSTRQTEEAERHRKSGEKERVRLTEEAGKQNKRARDKDGRVGVVAIFINKLSHGLIFRRDCA